MAQVCAPPCPDQNQTSGWDSSAFLFISSSVLATRRVRGLCRLRFTDIKPALVKNMVLRVDTARQGNERIEDLVDTIVEELDERAVEGALGARFATSPSPVRAVAAVAAVRRLSALPRSSQWRWPWISRRCSPRSDGAHVRSARHSNSTTNPRPAGSRAGPKINCFGFARRLRAGENRPNRTNRANQQHESRESGE